MFVKEAHDEGNGRKLVTNLVQAQQGGVVVICERVLALRNGPGT